MSACDRQLEQYLAVLPARTIDECASNSCATSVENAIDTASQPSVPEQASGKKVKAKKIKKPKKPKGNAPAFELMRFQLLRQKSELRRIAGVDLTTIDGIDVMTAQTILAEVGTDMSAFKNEDNFASWLGLTPNEDRSAGKVVRRSRRKVKIGRASCRERV